MCIDLYLFCFSVLCISCPSNYFVVDDTILLLMTNSRSQYKAVFMGISMLKIHILVRRDIYIETPPAFVFCY